MAAEGRQRNLGVDLIKSRATEDFRELCIEALDARMQYRSGLLMERQLNLLAAGLTNQPRTTFRTAVVSNEMEVLSHFDTTSVSKLHALFTCPASAWWSSAGLGEDPIISKNKEMINNPAMTAPIIICDPDFLLLFSKHSGCHSQLFSAFQSSVRFDTLK